KNIERVNIVINYDIPDCADTYLQRVWQSRLIWYERACNLIDHFMCRFKRGLKLEQHLNSEWRVVAMRKKDVAES
ncbi:hypothetical protein MKW92_004034, partial [Papaver armeniacum]